MSSATKDINQRSPHKNLVSTNSQQSSIKKNQEKEESSTPSSPLSKKYFSGENLSRKKKKTNANRDIRKERFSYNQYVERRSILDTVYNDSLIAKSPFRGLLRFIFIIGILYVLNHLTVKLALLLDLI